MDYKLILNLVYSFITKKLEIFSKYYLEKSKSDEYLYKKKFKKILEFFEKSFVPS